MRLTLPIISMVITLLHLLKYSAGQWNTLVNFGAALSPLGGQFSVAVNIVQHQLRFWSTFHVSLAVVNSIFTT
jgi:hypothetical protein